MDEHQLDRFTRNVARVLDRRRGLQGLLALGAVPLGVTLLANADDAEAGGKCKPNCSECQHCKKGKCHKTNSGKKQCKKGKCKPKDNGTTCSTGTCQAGVCQSTTPPPPPCTGLKPTATGATKGLQEAIDAAEAGATLTLCPGTWNLTSTVVIGKNLTLIGAGAGTTVLDGGNAVRVLEIVGTVTLQDLTAAKGKAVNGAAIFNSGSTLTLLGVSLTGNTATNGAGGIHNSGTVTLQTGSQVTGNTAFLGGGIYNFGSGTMTLQTGSSVTGNTATNGGGIYHEGGTLTLQTGSSVTGNTASGTGGGIHYVSGTVTLEGTDPSPIVVNNCTDNCGGALAVAKCAATPVSC